jgi:hypothetical protein
MKKTLKHSEDALERNFRPRSDLNSNGGFADPRSQIPSSASSPSLYNSSRLRATTSPYYIHQLPGRRISKMVLYETTTVIYINFNFNSPCYKHLFQHYYLVGHDKQRGGFELLRVERNRPEDLQITCIAKEYTLREVMAYLNSLDPTRGGARKCGIAYGILYEYQSTSKVLSLIIFFPSGFVRFVQYWYMVLISKKKKVGSIGPHYIYSITGAYPHSDLIVMRFLCFRFCSLLQTFVT